MKKEIGIMVLILLVITALFAAAPNLYEAATRSKVARARSNLSRCASGLFAYRLDYGVYPPCDLGWIYPQISPVHVYLTTPTAFIAASEAEDPFNQQYGERNPVYYANYEFMKDHDYPSARFLIDIYGVWKIGSVGPDGVVDSGLLYDPTNGFDSRGDLMRCEKTWIIER